MTQPNQPSQPSSDDPFVDHRSMGAAGPDPLGLAEAAAGQVSSADRAHLGQLGTSAVGTEELLRVDNLSVDFPTDDGVVHAVRGVSYSLRSGEVLGIVGESGSGKSVSSMAVMGLLPRSARINGSISFRGESVLDMPPAVQRSLRGRKIAMIFQDPMTAMNPVHTVGDQLAEAVLSHELMPKRKAMARAEEALAMVGIPQPKQRLRNYPHEFSGGMRQRAMIAMAIIN